MRIPNPGRQALTALLVGAILLVGTAVQAAADEVETQKEQAKTATVKTETVIVTKNGEKTIHVVGGKGGRFVVAPDEAAKEGEEPSAEKAGKPMTLTAVVTKDGESKRVTAVSTDGGKTWRTVHEETVRGEEEGRAWTYVRTPALPGKDGGLTFVVEAVEAGDEQDDETTPVKKRVQIVVRGTPGEGNGARVLEADIAKLELGGRVLVLGGTDDAEEPADKERRRLHIHLGSPHGPGAMVLSRRLRAGAPAQGSPLPTVLRWLTGENGKGPLASWFEGGADVPLAGLRDALTADGWTARSLGDWLGRRLRRGARAHGVPPAPPHARHARRPGPGWGAPSHEHARPHAWWTGPWGNRGAMPPGPRGHPTGWGGSPRGWDGGPRIEAHSRAFILWNDGSGWRHRAIPMPPGAGFGPGHPPFHGPWAPPHGPEVARPPRRSHVLPGQGPDGDGGLPPEIRALIRGFLSEGAGLDLLQHFLHGAAEGATEDRDGALPPEIQGLIRGLLREGAQRGEAAPSGQAPSAARAWALAEQLGLEPRKLIEALPEDVRDSLRERLGALASDLEADAFLVTDPDRGCSGDCSDDCSGDCENCPHKGKCHGKTTEGTKEASSD